MANTKSNLQDYIRFVLSSNYIPSIRTKNVVGWNDVGLDAARNTDYHGVLTQVTQELSFTGDEKTYIEDVYNSEGILGKLFLIVYKLEEDNGELRWVEKHFLYADFNKMRIKGGSLSIYFSSSSLVDLLDSYEDEDFEIERTETIDNQPLAEMDERFIRMNGRSLISYGKGKTLPSNTDSGFYTYFTTNNNLVFYNSIVSNVISEGPDRFSPAFERDVGSEGGSNPIDTAVGLLYDQSVNELESIKKVKVKIVTNSLSIFSDQVSRLSVVKWKRTDGDVYSVTEEIILYETTPIAGYFGIGYWSSNNLTIPPPLTGLTFEAEFEVEWNEGLMFCVVKPGGDGVVNYKIEETDIYVNEVAFYEPSPNIKFNFFYDVLDRLMLILTGRKNAFYSNVLGRVSVGYNKNGEYGLIGFLSGLWVRNFKRGDDKYKSPTISIKDALQSICNVFNLGTGVENIGSSQRLIVEDIRYFYREEIIGAFPIQITDSEKTIDAKSFYSGLEFGYEKVQKLDQEMGLDEPNVKSNFITPISNSKYKFNKLSKIRADEYKLETLRRKPILDFPDEQLTGDDDNWLLDLKESDTFENEYEQVHWTDRLEKEPTGIHDPDSFTSMIFTPMRMMLRLASIFNSGTYLFKNKFINFTSSLSNRELSMQFKGETDIKESDNIQISALKRPIFKNEIIKFTHPYTSELENMIFGETEVTVNGSSRFVPNFYLHKTLPTDLRVFEMNFPYKKCSSLLR
jgi:hypothetical protein